jgi:hypothetical protein
MLDISSATVSEFVQSHPRDDGWKIYLIENTSISHCGLQWAAAYLNERHPKVFKGRSEIIIKPF